MVGPNVGFFVVGAIVGYLVGEQLSTLQNVLLSQLHTSNKLSKMLPARQVWNAITVCRVVSQEAKVEQPGSGRLDGPSPRQTLSGFVHECVWLRWRMREISGRLLDIGFILVYYM